MARISKAERRAELNKFLDLAIEKDLELQNKVAANQEVIRDIEAKLSALDAPREEKE